MKPNTIIINPKDNVAVVLVDLSRGEMVMLPDGTGFAALGSIPYSHKVALRDFASGEEVLKYGEIIGSAKTVIKRGGWIHTHNLEISEK